MTTHMVVQTVLAILGTLTICSLNSKNQQVRKWGNIIGLANEPFWLYSSWSADQYGMMLMTLVYGAAYIQGAYKYWRGDSK